MSARLAAAASTPRLTLLVLLAFTFIGCSSNVDLKQALQVTDLSTGWFDTGIVNGQNKLVPSVTFRLKNASNRTLRSVQLNVVFNLVPENEEWDAMLTQGISSEGLSAGASTNPITVRSNAGFTSEAPRAEMLEHRLFKDVVVRLFAKYGSNQWVPMGDYKVARQLLTR
jgi:hypothetical protein